VKTILKSFDKIIGFGDSFMWGDELVDPVLKAKHNAPGAYWTENTRYREQQCFLGLLGTHYQVPTENFGWPGGSMQSDIWCYLWWRKHETLDPDRVLVLVCHTDANRTSYYHANRQMFPNDPPWHRFVHSAWVRYAKADITPEWSSMVKQHNRSTQGYFNFAACRLRFLSMLIIQFCGLPVYNRWY